MDQARTLNRQQFKKVGFKRSGLMIEEYADRLRKKKKIGIYEQKRKKNIEDSTELNEFGNRHERNQILTAINPRLVDSFIPIGERIILLYDSLVAEATTLEVFYIVESVRELLCKNLDSIMLSIIQSGFVTKLLLLVGHESKEIQRESSWCLTNIAASQHSSCLLLEDAPTRLLEVYPNTQDAILKDHIIWTLGNLAGDSINTRDLLWETSLPKILIELFTQGTIILRLLRTAVWTLSNLFRGLPFPDPAQILKFVPSLCVILESIKDEKVLIDILWSVSYITASQEEEFVDVILEELPMKKIMKCLECTNKALKVPSLRIVGNIAACSALKCQMLFDHNVLHTLQHSFVTNNIPILREVCWILSNLAAGPIEHIQLIINQETLLTSLFRIISTSDITAKKEATIVFCNLVSEGSESQIQKLVNQGILHAINYLLGLKCGIPLLKLTLKMLDGILAVGENQGSQNLIAINLDEIGGVKTLEALQLHEHMEIYDNVVLIMEKYYNLQGVDQVDVEANSQSSRPQNIQNTLDVEIPQKDFDF